MKLVLLLVMMPVLLAASVNLCNGPCRCYQVIAGVGAGSSVLNCDNAVIYKKLRLKDIIGFQHLNLRGAKFVADCGTFASPTLQAIDMRNAHSSSPVCALVRECPLVANKVLTSANICDHSDKRKHGGSSAGASVAGPSAWLVVILLLCGCLVGCVAAGATYLVEKKFHVRQEPAAPAAQIVGYGPIYHVPAAPLAIAEEEIEMDEIAL